jgi:hypothetical protein
VRLENYRRIVAAIATSVLMGSAIAQSNTAGQLFDRFLNSGRQANPTSQQLAGQQSLPAGMTPGAKPPEPMRNTPWHTKAELLEAARNGEFRGLPEIRVNADQAAAPLTDSVIHILRAEYAVPTLDTGKTAGSMTCRSEASEEIRRLLTAITALQIATLSENPPAFYADAPTQGMEQNIRISLNGLGKGDGLCSMKVMGVEHPHPYGAAMRQLADEFGSATKEYVENQRTTLKAAYEDEQARVAAEQKAKADAAAKQVAAEKAAAQARNDAERARIQADQKRQQQQQQSRVAG